MSVSKTNNPLISDRVYLITAFIEGAVVLSVEILGAKILSPFFGNSLTVWTSVIGITITFLTAGYYAGGMLSQKNNLHKTLSFLLAVASVFILLMPLWAPTLLISFANSSIYTGSILSAALLLGPPMLFLGATSPVIIQQLSRQANNPGKKAGLVYAASTFGGICLVFIFGFWIIPSYGISLPLVALSFLLFSFSIYLFKDKKQFVIAFVLILCMLKLMQAQKPVKGGSISVPYITEGLMGQLKVMDKYYPGNPAQFRHLIINGIPETIIGNNEDAISGWPYTHKTAVLASLKKNNSDVLLFGFGAGVMATEFRKLRMKTDVVEIDMRLLSIAKRYFYFNDSAITYTVDDARHYMRSCKKKYDLITFDVFNGEITPSYLFTQEGVQELKSLLKPKGMITIQFNELLDPEKISAYQSICNTLLSKGFKVYYNLETSEISDIIIAASLDEIDFSLLDKKSLNACCTMQPWIDEFIKNPMVKFDKPAANAVILTDDKPILDILNAGTLKHWRQWAITNYALPEMQENQRLFK